MQIKIIVDRPKFQSEEERKDILQKTYKKCTKGSFSE